MTGILGNRQLLLLIYMAAAGGFPGFPVIPDAKKAEKIVRPMSV